MEHDLNVAIERLVQVFNLYIAASLGLPELESSDDSTEVVFSMTMPSYIDVEKVELDDESEEEFMESLREGAKEYVDYTLTFDYNASTRRWAIYYMPISSYGFELWCSDLYSGIEQAVSLLVQQIAFIEGDLEEYVGDLDRELEDFLKEGGL